jgi:hypothetical protein
LYARDRPFDRTGLPASTGIGEAQQQPWHLTCISLPEKSRQCNGKKMSLIQKNSGKITIYLETDGDKINSRMEFQGLARKKNVVATTLLCNFVTYTREKGLDPRSIIDRHLDRILQELDHVRQAPESAGSHLP